MGKQWKKSKASMKDRKKEEIKSKKKERKREKLFKERVSSKELRIQQADIFMWEMKRAKKRSNYQQK